MADVTEWNGRTLISSPARKVIIGASAARTSRPLSPCRFTAFVPGAQWCRRSARKRSFRSGRLTPVSEGYALLFAVLVFALLLITKIEGWADSNSAYFSCCPPSAIEIVAFAVQQSHPVLVPTGSAHVLLALAAIIIVLRETWIAQAACACRRHQTSATSDRMLGQVFDDSFDAIIVIDSDCLITAANRTARSLFSSETLAGSSARSALPNALVEEANR